MYCPNCGNKNSQEQKFCRSCGLGLQKVAQSLTEQLPTNLEQTLEQRKESLERLGVAALSIFGVGVVSFILYAAFSKLMLTQGKLLASLILLAFIIVMGCGLLSVILFAKAKEIKETSAKRQLANPPGEPTGELEESSFEALTSIAEPTTKLLNEKHR